MFESQTPANDETPVSTFRGTLTNQEKRDALQLTMITDRDAVKADMLAVDESLSNYPKVSKMLREKPATFDRLYSFYWKLNLEEGETRRWRAVGDLEHNIAEAENDLQKQESMDYEKDVEEEIARLEAAETERLKMEADLSVVTADFVSPNTSNFPNAERLLARDPDEFRRQYAEQWTQAKTQGKKGDQLRWDPLKNVQ